MLITAAVARSPGQPFRLEHVDLDDPRADEVLVKVHSTGICHTDLSARDQRMPTPIPAVLGHEGAGVVERVGVGVTKFAVGDHVVMTFDHCGHCVPCTTGYSSYCVELVRRNLMGCRLDGSPTVRDADNKPIASVFFAQSSFATYAIGTERNLVKVSKDIDLALLGQLGCGIQTGAAAIFNRLKLTPGTSVLICGVGPVGMAAVMAAKVAGCTSIVAFDLQQPRLEAALTFGATAAIAGSASDLPDRLRAIAPLGFDAVVETSGAQTVMDLAMGILRPLGTCVLLASGREVRISVSALLSAGRCLCGSSIAHGEADTFIPHLIELYRQGLFPIDRLVTRYRLDQINEACAAAESGQVIKPVLVMP